MKTYFKRFLNSCFARWVVGGLIRMYLRLAHVTTRWTLHNFKAIDDLLASQQGFIVAFWHNRLALAPFLWRRQSPFYMLISDHRDGKMIANIIKPLGISCIHGSTSHNSLYALKSLITHIRQNKVVGITPDGPRGPKYHVSEGIAFIAQQTKCPVICCSYAQKHEMILNTWDSFAVPLPFGRGIKVWGDPIYPNSEDKSLERMTKMIASSLYNIQEVAQQTLRKNG